MAVRERSSVTIDSSLPNERRFRRAVRGDKSRWLQLRCNQFLPSSRPALVTHLLETALSDVEVVSRELSLSPAMSERLRRALDCLQCIELLLETETNERVGDEADAWAERARLVQGFLEAWPDDLLAMLTEQNNA